MFSPVKAMAAGFVVFAIGGALLIAQPFDQRSSAPAAAAPGEAAGTNTFATELKCNLGSDITVGIPPVNRTLAAPLRFPS